MVRFALDLAAQQNVSQGGSQCDAEDRRRQHDERLRVRERLEEPSPLPVQAEDRNERDRDDEKGEENGRGDLDGGLVQELGPLLGRNVRRSMLELLVTRLDHHDLGVDRGAHGDGDAAEAHDRRRDVQEVHRDERERHGDGQADDRKKRAAKM